MDTGSLALIVAAVIAFLQEVQNKGRFTTEQQQAAQLALSKAFHATESYYAQLADGVRKDKKIEHEIAELWDAVAIHVQPFDSALANRLGLKSRFWREGAAWTDKQIADAKIQLDKVRRDSKFSLI
jgi:hypothetical protein